MIMEKVTRMARAWAKKVTAKVTAMAKDMNLKVMPKVNAKAEGRTIIFRKARMAKASLAKTAKAFMERVMASSMMASDMKRKKRSIQSRSARAEEEVVEIAMDGARGNNAGELSMTETSLCELDWAWRPILLERCWPVLSWRKWEKTRC